MSFPNQFQPGVIGRFNLPVATREVLIDDPTAYLNRLLKRSALQTDITKGISSYSATVLLSSVIDKESHPMHSLIQPLQSAFGWLTVDGAVPSFLCWVDVLDGVMSNPMNYINDPVEYIKRSLHLRESRLFTPADTLITSERNTMLKDLGIGSRVRVSFTDSNKTHGHITGIEAISSFALDAAAKDRASARATHEYSNNRAHGVTQNPMPGIEVSDPNYLDLTFRELVDELLTYVSMRGYEFEYRGTYRDSTRQNYYKQQGWSTVTKGFHNNVVSDSGVPAALAADLIPVGLSTKEAEAGAYQALMEEAQIMGIIETGGEWRRGSMYDNSPWKKFNIGWDPGHVQMRGLSNIADVTTADEYAARVA